MSFDGNITVGALLNVAAMLLGGLYFLWRMESKLGLLIQETSMRHGYYVEKFEVIDKKIKELVDATVKLAEQEIRLNNMDERMQQIANRINETTTTQFKKKTAR
jgi:division protein CdvB (Snf7/Vps24/ESCRT-III family)